MVGKIPRTQSEPHVELAEYSRWVVLHSHRCARARGGKRARRNRPRNRRAAAGCLCFGERTERHPDAIAEDGAKYAIRSRKDAHRKMEDRRRDQATDAGERGVHPAQLAIGAAGNDRATEQRTGRCGSEFQALPQPRCAVRRLWRGGGIGGSLRIERRNSEPWERSERARERAPSF